LITHTFESIIKETHMQNGLVWAFVGFFLFPNCLNFASNGSRHLSTALASSAKFSHPGK
jgi:hypothetical protein